MASTRHRFSCGHKGFGAVCHRCEAATKLEKNPKGLKPEAVKAEVERLKGPQKKKGQPYTPNITG